MIAGKLVLLTKIKAIQSLNTLQQNIYMILPM